MTTSLLAFKDVSLKTNNQYLVKNLNFELNKNEIVTLIGPNGAGKSTVAKLALNILKPSTGKIWRNKNIKTAYVPQKFMVDKALPLKVKRLMQINTPLNNKELNYYLEQMGVVHLKNSFVSELSGGELQRILLARAAAQRANLLVLDEPLQGVDFANEVNIYEHIALFRKELNCTILLISHDLNIVMYSTDRVICLDKHICCIGRPEEVMKTKHYSDLLGDREHIFYSHKPSIYK